MRETDRHRERERKRERGERERERERIERELENPNTDLLWSTDVFALKRERDRAIGGEKVRDDHRDY